MGKVLNKRFRLTPDEFAMIEEIRAQRIADDSQRGASTLKATFANAKTGVLDDPNIRPTIGAVPGMNADPITGELRGNVVVDVTSESVGVISDAHWPFHDLHKDADGNFHGAYMTAITELRERGVQTLILNGDMMDCFHLSSHEKLEARRDWKWELDVTRAMLKHLREFFGDKVRIIYREGNHEERFARYMAKHAKELSGVYDLSELMKLRDQGIEWVSGRAKMTIGKLWIDHGHEWFGSGGVVPARNYRMKAVDNIMVGHVHKTSHDLFRRPLGGDFIAGWSVGCLCDLNPHYAPRNNWNHGFAHVRLSTDGNFTVNNHVVIDGTVR